MEEMKQIIQGIYQFMLDVQVPVFGYFFSLWVIFLWGLLGGFVAWFIIELFD